MTFSYPIRAAAKATGITVETLRAWERRYKAVTPARTERGRLYDDADIRRLVLLRRAVESGRSISQVANLSDGDLEALGSHPVPLAPPACAAGSAAELPILLDALQACDDAALNHEMGRLALLLRPSELVHQVVLPLMRHAGAQWEQGRLHVAQEHMLSASVRNLLGGLIRLQPPAGPSGTLLLTTPPGELHEFGVLAASMLAAGQGFRGVYLGPNLPAREILYAAGRSAPRAVVLAVMKRNATPAVRADIRWLASKLPAPTELWVGGPGAERTLRGTSGVLRLDDFSEFERHLVRLKAN